ncbi:MAG: S8 family serine peptidase [Flavobacteriaceae bacterium]|nr:S8 family serine peptidase [Flavobacteriaceae bacterium]
MKKLYTILLTALVMMTGCEKSNINDMELPQEENTGVPFLIGSGTETFAYPINQIVVQYDALLSEADKQLLRDQYGVATYKNCTCADPTLELWIFNLDRNGNLPNGNSLEETVLGAKEETELEAAEVNPTFQHMGQKLNVSFGLEDMAAAIMNVVPSNNNVTIAVLDTGVDYNYFGFENPFLYNSQSNHNACTDNGMDDIFGWDFVNEDNNPFDDYGHGTIITSLIYNKLTELNIDFQILPVKAFNQNGKGAYFDILCGLKYAINKEGVDVINMSFGWYNTNYELLHRFIVESEDKVMLVSSAGNDYENNDQIPHYPSSYNVSNSLSIAAINNRPFNVALASFSNHGVNSVDIAAIGEEIPFYITPYDFIEVSGTSYSNAFASAFSGQLFEPGMSPQQLKALVLSNTMQHNSLALIRYQSYIYY